MTPVQSQRSLETLSLAGAFLDLTAIGKRLLLISISMFIVFMAFGWAWCSQVAVTTRRGSPTCHTQHAKSPNRETSVET